MSKGDKQSYRHFDNQKQLRLTDDPNFPTETLSGDASTDNRQYQTEDLANTAAMELMQAQSGMFMHPMHDVTQTDQVNGDKVLEAMQADLDEIESQMMDNSTGELDPREDGARDM
ncbi:MAG TPA: hypothetical protein VFV52_10670 [Bacilli bacterium]|nr:hypothetical protein [Bacilli bacterium]